MPFNLGPMEMVLVLVAILLLFGAKRLPELGQGVGKGIREFKRSLKDVSHELQGPSRQVPPASRADALAPLAAPLASSSDVPAPDRLPAGADRPLEG